MFHSIWRISLLLACILPVAEALQPGDKVPDFVMPTLNEEPQRLSEQVGKPLMLIWLGDCAFCEEELIDWQYLAESLALDGLQTWVIWRKQAGYKAPWSRLPVLEYDASNEEAWWFDSAPAVMFISPEGLLDSLFIDNINDRKFEVSSAVKLWFNNKKWFQ